MKIKGFPPSDVTSQGGNFITYFYLFLFVQYPFLGIVPLWGSPYLCVNKKL